MGSGAAMERPVGGVRHGGPASEGGGSAGGGSSLGGGGGGGWDELARRWLASIQLQLDAMPDAVSERLTEVVRRAALRWVTDEPVRRGVWPGVVVPDPSEEAALGNLRRIADALLADLRSTQDRAGRPLMPEEEVESFDRVMGIVCPIWPFCRRRV